jgi:hypothetical protein
MARIVLASDVFEEGRLPPLCIRSGTTQDVAMFQAVAIAERPYLPRWMVVLAAVIVLAVAASMGEVVGGLILICLLLGVGLGPLRSTKKNGVLPYSEGVYRRDRHAKRMRAVAMGIIVAAMILIDVALEDPWRQVSVYFKIALFGLWIYSDSFTVRGIGRLLPDGSVEFEASAEFIAAVAANDPARCPGPL